MNTSIFGNKEQKKVSVHSRLSLLSVLALSALLAGSFVASVSASEYYTLDNWEVNSIWHGETFDDAVDSNFTWSVQYGSVKLNNATNTGKFCFSLITGGGVNTGYSVEIYVGAQGADYLSADNTLYFKSLTAGVETLLYTATGDALDASSFKVVYDGTNVNFFTDGVKRYQNTASDITLGELQFFTENVPLPIGDITQPSCFTGSFAVTVGSSSAGSVGTIDTGEMSGIMTAVLGLMIAMLPLMIYMAVFKMIPRLLKGIKL